MALKSYKPTSAGRRHRVIATTKHLTKKAPEKNLTKKLTAIHGRNNKGRVTVRHRGGAVKRAYRAIDFKRDKFNVPAVVEALEYDPNRSAHIALLKYMDGDRRYILAPEGLEVGSQVVSGTDVALSVGNTMPLSKIPQGTIVHAVEMLPGSGAKIGRTAGSSIQVMGGDKGYIQLRMPSGEIRLVKDTCLATIGDVGNSEHKNQKIGKAGNKRRKGFRPAVRGVAMSYKHPHGAGQGKSGRHGTGGPAKDRWGNKVGTRTRTNRKVTSKFIVRRRPSRHAFKIYKTII
jgi:large subunit ribosomal protein L2